MNKIQLMGYLDQAPEIRAHGHLREKATFSLVTVLSWQNEQGDWQRQTDWHSIKVFKQSIIVWFKEENIKKDDLLFVQGSLVYEETPQKKKKTPHIVVDDQGGRVFWIHNNNAYQNLVLSKAGITLPISSPVFGKINVLETSNDHL